MHDINAAPTNNDRMDHPAQQYYNPQLGADEEKALLRRNFLLLMTGQAALGLIGPGILGIAVEPRAQAVVIHVAALQDTAELAADIAEIVAELEAYLYGGPEGDSIVSSALSIGPPDSNWLGQHAPLYIAKR